MFRVQSCEEKGWNAMSVCPEARQRSCLAVLFGFVVGPAMEDYLNRRLFLFLERIRLSWH